MIVSKIDHLTDEVASITNIAPEKVQEVIRYQFAAIRAHMIDPKPPTTLNLEHLGKIRGKLARVNLDIRYLLPLMRTDPAPYLHKFRYLWGLRQDLIKVAQMRKYSKRFGKWHH